MNMELTQETLKKLLRYDPETGGWNWLVSTNGRILVEDWAGSWSGGYLCIGINRKIYKAHRLAWLYMTGQFPVAEIDHIDGDSSNNRWVNLREATRSQNNANSGKRKNNTSGYKGVRWHAQSKRWVAQISVDGKTRYLGLSLSKDEARAKYIAAAELYHKEFARIA